jgi:hypothetical protein
MKRRATGVSNISAARKGKPRNVSREVNPKGLARSNLRLDFGTARAKHARMIELEVYAAGVRNPEKMMALALELDVISGLRYKVDTNHDIIYMEFVGQAPTLSTLKSLFIKTGLEAKFVGQLPPEISSKKSTQRIENVAV